MADTSLDSSADNPFAAPELKDNQPAPMNPFSAFAEEEAAADITNASNGANWSAQFNPDQFAKARKLSEDAIPPDMAYRNLPDLEKVKRTQALIESASKDRSVLRYFSQNPKDLAYANPDELDNLTGLNWAMQAVPQSFQSGLDQTRLGLAEYENAFGTPTPELDQLIQQLDKTANSGRSFGAHEGFVTTGIPLLAQNLPQMGYSILKSGEGFIKGAVAGAGAGAVVGAAVGAPAGGVGAIPGAIGGAATGFGIGGRVGATYGGLQAQFQLQTGLALNQFKKIKDSDGKPLDPDVMKWAAIVTGLGSAGLEQTGIMATIGRIPGMEKVVGTLTIPGMKKFLQLPGAAGVLTNFVKGYAGAVTVESVTEGLQQGLQIMAQELAKKASPGNFEMMTAEEAAQQVAQATYQGGQVAALLGGFTEGTHLVHDLASMERSRQNNNQLRLNLQKLDGNKLIERAPDVAARIIDAQNPDRAVYMPADKFVELYQSQGLDPYGPPLPNWRNRLDEALQTGGDVRVSLGEFIGHFSRDPKVNPILDLTRGNPNDYLPAEIKTYTDSLNELMDSELARAEAKKTVVDLVPSLVREELQKQAQNAGYTPEASKHYATVIGSYIETRAEQLGITPEQFVAQHGPNILAAQAPQQGMSNTITNGNGMADITELQQPAYHGSPHKFEKFDISKIGTGEGAQAFGYGLYFAGNKGIAEGYQKRLSREQAKLQYDGKEIADSGLPQHVQNIIREMHSGELSKADYTEGLKGLIEDKTFFRDQMEQLINHLEQGGQTQDFLNQQPEFIQHGLRHRIDEENALTDLEGAQAAYRREDSELRTLQRDLESMKAIDESKITNIGGGRLYQVDLPDDEHLMAWDVPVMDQSPLIQKAFTDMGIGIEPEQDPLGVWESEDTGETVASGARPITGEEAYRKLSDLFEGGDKAASEYLLSKGILGHKFLDANSRHDKYKASYKASEDRWISQTFDTYQQAHDFLSEVRGWDMSSPGIENFARIEELPQTHNYVIYDDKHVTVTSYKQGERGSITFQKDAQAVIKVFEQRDMSTILHEAGHFFLETTAQLADSSPEIKADYEIIKKHFGIGDKITRDQHEAFARAAEAYFMQGKAPSPELKPAFQKFRQWLVQIYRQISKLGGRVHPEIAQVFDRMLVSKQRLEAVAQEPTYGPLFKTAEEMGIDPQDYLEYQKLVEDLRSEYMDRALGRIVGQSARLSTGWMKQIENQFATEAEQFLKDQAPYKHKVTFTTQKTFKIDRDAFKAKYSEEAMKKFPRSAFAKDGLDPDIAAELLGYPTADEMVNDFVNAPPIKEAARERAKTEMVTRFGQDFDKTQIVDLVARQEMAEDGRLTVLAKEYRALSQKNGITVSDKGPKALAKEIAIRNLYPKKVLDVNQFVSQAAVKRAATMAESATLKGKWAEAADWKRKQILAQAIDNETQKLNRTIEKIRNKAAKYTRTAPKGIDPSTMEQIRALVTDYEFTRVSNKKLARREALSDYLDKMEEDGLVVDVPDYLRRDAAKVNYKQLTVEQLLGFGDALDNLEHLGRLKNKLKTLKGQRDYAEVKQEILNSLHQRPEKKRKMDNYGQEHKGALDKLGEFTASWLKPEQIIEWLDSGNLQGPMAEHVFNLIADAQHKKNDMNLEYNERLMKIFDGLDPKNLQELKHITSLGDGPESMLTKEQIYAVALNMGNDQNRQKLMEGEVWNDQILTEVLSHMGKEDWDRVQKVWDAIETLWPKIAALEKRLTGVTPPRVEAREFTNQHGTYRGGYYPVVYDFKAQRGLNIIEDTTPVDKKFMDGLVDNRNLTPGTNHKYTVARTKVAKPIKLSLSAIPGHVHTVIHDLTHREAIRTAYKILWDPEIKEAISKVESEAVHSQLQAWLRAVATEHSLESDPHVQFIQRVRTGMTMYSMGYRLSVAISQPLGFLTTLTRVGAKNLLPAIYQMSRHPLETMDTVKQLSGEIRHRFNTQERDIRDAVNQLTKSKSPLDKVRQYAFYLIGAMDQYVAVASWLGAYNEQLQKTPGDKELAIRNADRVVRLTQGTGTVKDMAKIMNDKGAMSLFTMFYSFFSAQYNMQVDLTRKTIRDTREGNWDTLFRERLPQWNYLVVMPAILGAYLTGQGPGDDENKAFWALKKVLLYPFSAMPFVRDAVGPLFTPFDYKLSPVSRFGESITKGLKKLFEQGDPIGAVEAAAPAVGAYFKLPLGQAVTSIEGLWQGLERNDLKATDAVYGRRGRQ